MKKDIESWPFKVIDEENNPKVQVEYLGENKTFTPQEISAMVLGKVRSKEVAFPVPIAETVLDERGCRDKTREEG